MFAAEGGLVGIEKSKQGGGKGGGGGLKREEENSDCERIRGIRRRPARRGFVVELVLYFVNAENPYT